MTDFQLTNRADGSVCASLLGGTQITIGLTRLVAEDDFSVEVDVRTMNSAIAAFHESYPLHELGEELISINNDNKFFQTPKLDSAMLPGGTANIAEAYDVALVHFLRRNYSSLQLLLRTLPHDDDDWRDFGHSTDPTPLPWLG